MAELEDEEYFLDDFEGLDFDNIPGLQALPIRRSAPELEVFAPSSTIPRNIVPPTSGSPVPSTTSDSVEYMDSAFLAAIDAMEARALSEMSPGKIPKVQNHSGIKQHAKVVPW